LQRRDLVPLLMRPSKGNAVGETHRSAPGKTITVHAFPSDVRTGLVSTPNGAHAVWRTWNRFAPLVARLCRKFGGVLSGEVHRSQVRPHWSCILAWQSLQGRREGSTCGTEVLRYLPRPSLPVWRSRWPLTSFELGTPHSTACNGGLIRTEMPPRAVAL
jgi:hypothetical protein